MTIRVTIFPGLLIALFMAASCQSGKQNSSMTCAGGPVTEAYLRAHDFREPIGLQQSFATSRVLDVYSGDGVPFELVDGRINTIWVRNEYDRDSLECWARAGDKVAALAIVDRDIDTPRDLRSNKYMLDIAARVTNERCDNPLQTLRQTDRPLTDCVNEAGHFSPFTQGMAEAHFRLFVCYDQSYCRSSSVGGTAANANYHFSKARSLGSYEALTTRR